MLQPCLLLCSLSLAVGCPPAHRRPAYHTAEVDSPPSNGRIDSSQQDYEDYTTDYTTDTTTDYTTDYTTDHTTDYSSEAETGDYYTATYTAADHTITGDQT